MKKTSVYLTESEADLLRSLAEREGRSQATILREALVGYDQRAEPDREFALDGCVTGDGTSAADIPEEEYLKGFGE